MIKSISTLSPYLADSFSGPVLYAYVWWILRCACHSRLTTLYFLARDGYLLKEIAERFCRVYHLPIQCRYLYCSRRSLRIPSYHLIGDEAYQLLLLGGYQVSIRSLLQRIGLTPEERAHVCADCGLSVSNEDRLLNHAELEHVRQLLQASPVYRALVQERSRAAYQNAIGYLRQEGLLSCPSFALVDSGWTGSMQRSLRQLLESAGFQGQLEGFYFGMYAAQKSSDDGIYHTWYFSPSGPIRAKTVFCNNLFECILAAPHGMTCSYTLSEGIYVPELSPTPRTAQLQQVRRQISDILVYTEHRLAETTFQAFDQTALLRDTYRRFVRYMTAPTAGEATYYGNFLFSDDVNETDQRALAAPEQLRYLNGYTLFARATRYLARTQTPASPELFWPCGTAAFLPKWKQLWYCWNIRTWEWIRYVLHKA